MEAAGDGRGGGRADEDLKTRTPHNDVGNKPKKENVWELLGFSYDQTSLENIVFLFFCSPPASRYIYQVRAPLSAVLADRYVPFER